MIVCSAEECRAKYKSDAPKEWYKDKENRKKSIKCSTEWNKKNVKRHRFFANRYAKEHKEERKEYTKKYEENKMKEYKAIGEINKDREVGNLIRSLK